jgi:hypothetical protein
MSALTLFPFVALYWLSSHLNRPNVPGSLLPKPDG